ncbi:MAG: M28 family metallopeptidase [Promethearchaeota archaeon]
MIYISSSRIYNEEAAINHVNALAFNRHSSSEGELKCINYITKELKKDGINPIIERFEWANTLTIVMKLIFILIFGFIILSQIIMLFPNITWIIFPLDIIFIVLILLGAKQIFDNTRTAYIGRKKKAKNVMMTVQCKDLYPKRPVIIFSAHHDTASLRLSMTMLKNLYRIAAVSLLTFLILSLIISILSFLAIFNLIQFDNSFFFIRNLALIIGIILLIIDAVILGNKKSDKSIGAIDNASGVAVLIELAKLLKRNPLNKTDVIFLWCGAEERGLWGSKQYCNTHFEELLYDYDLDKSYNINIDMVGTYIGMIDKHGLFKKKSLNSNLDNILKASANQQNIKLKNKSVRIGFGSSDHAVFRAYAKKEEKKGFQVSFLISNKDAKYVHSKNDTPEKCSAKNLNGCIEICYNAIQSLDLRVE